MPGLDGLRALAVAVVVAYHLGLPWAPGGLLGVGVFFTLSGYLITDLLLSNWESTGSLQLRQFWARRARRLLPALFVMLAAVTIWVAVANPSSLGALRGDVVAATAYVSNWWLAFQHVSYFARFGPPSPLGHLWSLAVEEQFYLAWPWLLWLGLVWARHRCERARARAAAASPVPAAEPLGVTTAMPPAARAAELRALGDLLSGRTVRGKVPVVPGAVEERGSRWLVAPRERRWLWSLAGATLLLALVSAVEMVVLYHPSFDPSRVYDGTDTRAFALLLGAALAMVWPSRGLRAEVLPGARRVVDGAGAVGLVVTGLLVCFTNQYSAFVYRGGLVLLALATVLVVAAAAHPASRLGRALGWGPLRWVGVRSYGIYLWHYPVIVLTTPTVTNGTDLPRVVLQIGATLALAEMSWRFVETPVRHGAIGRALARLRSGPRQLGSLSPRRWLTLGTLLAGLVSTIVALGGAMPAAPAGTLAANGPLGTQTPTPASLARAYSTIGTTAIGTTTISTATISTATTVTATTPAPTTTRALTTTVPTTSMPARTPGHGKRPESGPARSGPTASSAAPVAAPVLPRSGTVPGQARPTVPSTRTGPKPLSTSCKSVLHLGDSTSESMVSSDYLPDGSQQLPAQYARVGVARSTLRIQGANSIVETLPGEENAYQMARTLVSQGYRGCWVIALGTNDAADVYVGSNVSMVARIKRMMLLVGKEPVLWVNVKTLLSSGPYSEANMQRWDRVLVSTCRDYTNMRVFNWAAMAKPAWFTPDGIHYNTPGSAPRAAAIADALATAFPAGTEPATHTGCVVNAPPQWHLPTAHFQ
jgi:peptidoglycan/LPS O-acetylase OafA/YrhL